MRIFQHLRGLRPDLHWCIPLFWGELVDAKGHPCAWPEEIDLRHAPKRTRGERGVARVGGNRD